MSVNNCNSVIYFLRFKIFQKKHFALNPNGQFERKCGKIVVGNEVNSNDN